MAVVITGVSQGGIGSACAVHFATQGFQVFGRCDVSSCCQHKLRLLSSETSRLPVVDVDGLESFGALSEASAVQARLARLQPPGCEVDLRSLPEVWQKIEKAAFRPLCERKKYSI